MNYVCLNELVKFTRKSHRLGTDIIRNVKCTKSYIISNKYLSWFKCILLQVRMKLPREEAGAGLDKMVITVIPDHGKF